MKKVFLLGILMLVSISLYGYIIGDLVYLVVCLFLAIAIAVSYHRMMTMSFDFLILKIEFILPLALLERAVYGKDQKEFYQVIENHRKRIFYFKCNIRNKKLNRLARLLQSDTLVYISRIQEEKDLPAAYKKAEEANIAIMAMK